MKKANRRKENQREGAFQKKGGRLNADRGQTGNKKPTENRLDKGVSKESRANKRKQQQRSQESKEKEYSS